MTPAPPAAGPARRARRAPALPSVGVWGLGKAGCALTHSLRDAGVSALSIGTRSRARRQALLACLPDVPKPHAHLPGLLRTMRERGSEVLFLAVSDDAIEVVAARLRQAPWLPPALVHLSGARGAEALEALSTRCHTGAFHPLAALDPARGIPEGTLVAVDAASAHLRRTLFTLGRRMGLSPARIHAGGHARYHAGAVISANLAVALLDIGIELLVASGLPEPDARRALAALLSSTAAAAQRAPLAEMLTGPVARGDVGTLRRHLAALAAYPAARATYRLLSPRLCAIAHLDEQVRAELMRVLTHPDA